MDFHEMVVKVVEGIKLQKLTIGIRDGIMDVSNRVAMYTEREERKSTSKNKIFNTVFRRNYY